MKIVKPLAIFLIVFALLVSIVAFGNHTASFWKLLRKEPFKQILYEDFSEATWNNVGNGVTSCGPGLYLDLYGGSYSSNRGFLTVYIDENQKGKLPCFVIKYPELVSEKYLKTEKISYFVITFDIWTEGDAPSYLYMRQGFEELNNTQNPVFPYTIDVCSFYNNAGVYSSPLFSGGLSTDQLIHNSIYDKSVENRKILWMSTSESTKDRICCVFAINHDDYSKSTLTYYLNGTSDKLVYTGFNFTGENCLSSFRFCMLNEQRSARLSIDNLAIYSFDRGYKGNINDVLKEVNYR